MHAAIDSFLAAFEAWNAADELPLYDPRAGAASDALERAAVALFKTVRGCASARVSAFTAGSLYIECVGQQRGDDEPPTATVRISNHPFRHNSHVPPVAFIGTDATADDLAYVLERVAVELE